MDKAFSLAWVCALALASPVRAASPASVKDGILRQDNVIENAGPAPRGCGGSAAFGHVQSSHIDNHRGRYVALVAGHDCAKGWFAPGEGFGERRFTLYSSSRALGAVAVGELEQDEVDKVYLLPIQGGEVPAGAVFALSAAAGWDLLPRLPRSQDPSNPTYRKIAGELLTKAGLALSRPRLTSIHRVDLDGDGSEEVLISGASRANLGSRRDPATGDYSFIVLRHEREGRVMNQLLHLEAIVEKQPAPPEGHRPFSCTGFGSPVFADLDGDGRLEIVIRGDFWEGWQHSVWRFDGRGARLVFEDSWGH